MSLSELEQSFRANLSKQREARRARLKDGGRTLSDLAHEEQHLLSRAATHLSGKGPEADWMADALGDFVDEDRQLFAVRALKHRNQFPRRFLATAVEVAVRKPDHRLLGLCARWHGAVRVMEAMIDLAQRGHLDDGGRRFLTYYVRSGIDEEPEEVRAALDRLRAATAADG